jgi:hypothetical protein
MYTIHYLLLELIDFIGGEAEHKSTVRINLIVYLNQTTKLFIQSGKSLMENQLSN